MDRHSKAIPMIYDFSDKTSPDGNSEVTVSQMIMLENDGLLSG